jgi:hypothetical protein
MPNPGASALGGIESITCSAAQWINTISTSGVPSCAQPAVGNISGLGTGVATALGDNTNASGGFPTVPVANAQLANSSLTIAGHSVALGGTQAIACADLSNGAAGCSTSLGTNVAAALGNNLSANGGVPKVVASGAKALATSAISSATCTSAQTDTATGALTTDAIIVSFNADPTAVTGYVPLTTGMLTIIVYPTADTVNFKVCNNTSASITPGAITLNWRVVR